MFDVFARPLGVNCLQIVDGPANHALRVPGRAPRVLLSRMIEESDRPLPTPASPMPRRGLSADFMAEWTDASVAVP
jgi:hypothetical protein